MRVKEDNCLQTGKLRVVHLDLFEWRHQLVHDPDTDVSDNCVLRLRHPKSTPLTDISGYDHVIAEQENIIQIHGSSGQTQKQMFSRMGAEQSNLEIVF